MQLHGYQQRARAEGREAFRAGKRAILFVAPTGAGKTVIIGDTVAAHMRAKPDGHVEIHAHRKELVQQLAATCKRFGLDVGAFGENAAAPVQVRMTQTILARGEVQRCTLAVFDEAHHYAADEWGTVAKVHKESGAIICGATATPERGDGRGLGHMFDHIVTVAQPRELVELWRQTGGKQGLVPVDVIGPRRKVPKGAVAQHPLEAYQKHGDGRRNVVFCPNLTAAREWCGAFNAAGIRAAVVSGDTDDDERKASLEAFARGTIRVILNVYVLTEGWDCPPCGVITIARPLGSMGMYIQIAGRGARPCEGKDRYTVLDLRGVSAPDALGSPDADRFYSLDEEGISTRNGAVAGERLCKLCKRPLDGATICPHCQKDNGLEVPGVAGIELARWQERYTGDPPDIRIKRLSKWLREAKAKGHKPYSAAYRYRGTYGRAPTKDEIEAAWRVA